MLISVEVEKKGGRLLVVGGKLYEEVAGLFEVNMKHSLQPVSCSCFIINTDFKKNTLTFDPQMNQTQQEAAVYTSSIQ